MLQARPEFVLFGVPHLVALVATIGLGVAFVLWARRLATSRQLRVAKLMAAALVLYRSGWIVDQWLRHGEPLRTLIPFHLCGIMFYLCAWMLWRRSYRIFEITYFWALGGTFLAMVTPGLVHGFPSFQFFEYFISHGVLVAALLFATLVFRFRPTVRSVWRAWATCLIYAALLFPLNFLIDTNFMYLRQKPPGETLLHVMGPWPWYLLVGAGVALVAFFLCYLPFALGGRYSAAPESAG